MSDSPADKSRLAIPDVISRPRRVIIHSGSAVPSVHRVLSDAYATIGNEINRLRLLSETEGLDARQAETLQRLIKSFSALQQEERSAQAAIEVGGKRVNLAELSDVQLAELVDLAREFIKPQP